MKANNVPVSRRTFLKASLLGAAGLLLTNRKALLPPACAEPPAKSSMVSQRADSHDVQLL
jgi:hypothetical protein